MSTTTPPADNWSKMRNPDRPQHLCAIVHCAMREFPTGKNGVHLDPSYDAAPEEWLLSWLPRLKQHKIHTLVLHLPLGLMPDGQQGIGSVLNLSADFLQQLTDALLTLRGWVDRLIVYLGPGDDSRAVQLCAHFARDAHLVIIDGDGDRQQNHLWRELQDPRQHLGIEPWALTDDLTRCVSFSTTQVLGDPLGTLRAKGDQASRQPVPDVVGEMLVLDNHTGPHEPDIRGLPESHRAEAMARKTGARARRLWEAGMSPVVPLWMFDTFYWRERPSLVWAAPVKTPPEPKGGA